MDKAHSWGARAGCTSAPSPSTLPPPTALPSTSPSQRSGRKRSSTGQRTWEESYLDPPYSACSSAQYWEEEEYNSVLWSSFYAPLPRDLIILSEGIANDLDMAGVTRVNPAVSLPLSPSYPAA